MQVGHYFHSGLYPERKKNASLCPYQDTARRLSPQYSTSPCSLLSEVLVQIMESKAAIANSSSSSLRSFKKRLLRLRKI